ncbi:hypothetical protein TNCV_4044441 [Trichonephila clavipes]|nr:hypothetical protein TNCV_4044441 [Trichonephila clavipes]
MINEIREASVRNRVLPNSTGKYRGVIVGNMGPTNQHKTWGRKLSLVGVIHKNSYEECDVEWKEKGRDCRTCSNKSSVLAMSADATTRRAVRCFTVATGVSCTSNFKRPQKKNLRDCDQENLKAKQRVRHIPDPLPSTFTSRDM